MHISIPAIVAFAAAALAAPQPAALAAPEHGHLEARASCSGGGRRNTAGKKYLETTDSSCNSGNWSLKKNQWTGLRGAVNNAYVTSRSSTNFKGCIYNQNNPVTRWQATIEFNFENGWDKSWISQSEMDGMVADFIEFQQGAGHAANFWVNIKRDNDAKRIGWIEFWGWNVGNAQFPEGCMRVE